MEQEWWLVALLVVVALGGLVLLALITVGLLDPLPEPEPRADSPIPASEVSVDPARAWVGIGAASLLVGAAMWVIKRTDWSLDES